MKVQRSSERPEPRSRRFYDMVGLALFFVGAAFLLWLTWPQNAPIPNALEYAMRLFAGSGSFVIPIIVMFVGAMYLVGFERFTVSSSTWGALLLFLVFVTWRHIAHMIEPSSLAPPPTSKLVTDANWQPSHVILAGGYVGAVTGTFLAKLFGFVASYLFLLMITCMAVVLLVDKPFIELLRQFRRPAQLGMSAAKQGVAIVRERHDTYKVVRDKKEPSKLGTLFSNTFRKSEPEEEAPAPTPKKRGLLLFGRDAKAEEEEEKQSDDNKKKVELMVNGAAAKEEKKEPALVEVPASKTTSTEPPLVNPHPIANVKGIFKLPPVSLLKESPPPPAKKQQQELTDKINVLEQTLDQFGIGANVVEIAHGPTVTRYEIQLAPGIKVSKIVSLADNLAMALEAIDVRVEAPIPGKSAIGIEVPNSVTSVVSLRECLETPEFKNASSKLTFAMGKDVAGVFRYADLTRMPHLLIGGSTNSGKSSCLNSIIASMIYRSTPREVQFIMIDPKRVELSLWEGIPHLMHPVVKDVKLAPGILRSTLREMERRYDLFSKIGTRNIDGYNQRVNAEEKLPYVVIVVDELADLMMTAAAEVETSICRLAQLARATGIHLVIATQRPSVDVITGTIKANISSRIAFAVSSQIDSRTILDMTGAERLIGRGDMLFLPIDASKPMRVQGCYLSEQETNALVEYLKEQEQPNYSIAPVETPAGTSGGGSSSHEPEEHDDELYESAVRLLVSNGHASTSMLQRRFKIGYTRAARLLDIMEENHIVGPLEGAKPREILVSKSEIDEMFREDALS